MRKFFRDYWDICLTVLGLFGLIVGFVGGWPHSVETLLALIGVNVLLIVFSFWRMMRFLR